MPREPGEPFSQDVCAPKIWPEKVFYFYTRARRLAAHIDNICTRVKHVAAMSNGIFGRSTVSAITESFVHNIWLDITYNSVVIYEVENVKEI